MRRYVFLIKYICVITKNVDVVRDTKYSVQALVALGKQKFSDTFQFLLNPSFLPEKFFMCH